MKKLLLPLAALGLLCFPLLSRASDSSDSEMEVMFVPRFDVNPFFFTPQAEDGASSEFTLGNSSFYSFFQGSASEHFSWLLVNHWLQAGGPQDWLYEGLGYSNINNFIDYANICLTFGGWNFTIGKDMIAMGGTEYDPWDYDLYYDFSTDFALCFPAYQWGVKVGYTTPSEMTTLALQMMTSPFGEHPFSSGLFSYSFQWTGDYGFFSPFWSISAIQRDRNDFEWLACIGQYFNITDRLTLSLDWYNRVGDVMDVLVHGNTARGSLCFSALDCLDLTLEGNFQNTEDLNWWRAGFKAEYYPIKDNRDLRTHCTLAYDDLLKSFSFNIGARFCIHVPGRSK